MVSNPSFDPNSFNRGLSSTEWKSLVTNQRTPLINKAISGRYAPGSTFKMCVLLAALEKGVITPRSQVFCRGYTELGDARFHCWKKHGHGLLNAQDAMIQSCDVYFYEIAKRTGIERIAAMGKRFGFGAKLEVDLPGEKAGLIPTPKWKRGALDAPWHKGETLIVGIGQGYLLVTPLQLAVMTARMANGGFAVVPRLTRSVSQDEFGWNGRGTFESLNLPPRHMQIIRNAMVDVVNSPHGTAYKSRITEPGQEMAGKTGTVQSAASRRASVKSGAKE